MYPSYNELLLLFFLSLGEQDDVQSHLVLLNVIIIVLCVLDIQALVIIMFSINTLISLCSCILYVLCQGHIDSTCMRIMISTKHDNIWKTTIVCAAVFESVVQLVLAMWVRC